MENLIPMVEFILNIDFLTTKEFCEKYNVPLPALSVDVENSVNNLLQIDAIKHKMFVDHAKKISKQKNELTAVSQIDSENAINVNEKIIYHNGKSYILEIKWGTENYFFRVISLTGFTILPFDCLKDLEKFKQLIKKAIDNSDYDLKTIENWDGIF